MRCVLQRVDAASIEVDGERIARIGRGLLALICVEDGDTPADAHYMITKIPNLRIFEDQDGKMNRSLIDQHGELLLVSQFTLMGDARHGRRPSFSRAARPEIAVPMLDFILAELRARGVPTQTGRFQAEMKVSLVNDGPVTLLLDSRKGF